MNTIVQPVSNVSIIVICSPLGQNTHFGISGVQITRILDNIVLFRGYPTTIKTAQVPEFTFRPLHQWAYEHGVELSLTAR